MSIELSEITIKKLDTIDKFRERFSLKDSASLKLPQIIVVGDQSCGKSSILEALSSIKLPKGLNTVTKRPIVVQMRRSSNERNTIKCDNETFDDVKDVEAKLKEVQGELITSEPVFVEVQSPTVPPLTVIDLPGIVQQVVVGQKSSMVEDVKQVAKRYMEQENSIILCVISSDTDFNNVGTIDLASKFDSDKKRTIGVLTKMDKVSIEEISAKIKILKNEMKPLEKGYYGLILPERILSLPRGEREGKEIEEFKKRGELWNECCNNLGMKNFTKKLVIELVSLINERLPVLKKTMENKLTKTNKDLEEFDGIHSSAQFQRKYLIEVKDLILSKVESALVKGREKLYEYKKCAAIFKENDNDKHNTFLFAQHRIFGDLNNQLSRHFKDNFKIHSHKYSVKYLQDLADRCSTEHIPIFMSSEPFKDVVNKHLVEYKKYSLMCLEKCHRLAEYFIDELISNNSDYNNNKFPALKNELKLRCLDQLSVQNEATKGHINLIFKSETRCFTQKALCTSKEDRDTSSDGRTNPGQDSMAGAISNKVQSRVQTSQSMNLQAAAKDKDGDNMSIASRDDPKTSSGKKLKETLEEYIQHMIGRLADVVPNLIMLTLFEEFHVHLQKNLNEYVTDEAVLRHFELSAEDSKRYNERQETKRNLEVSLRELKSLLNESNSSS